jgi:hypothetical protein
LYKVRLLHKAAIQTIVEKFHAKGYLKNFNLFHDDHQQVSDVTIFNSFISDEFVLNEEKRIISGPAMIADMPLYRNNKEVTDAIFQNVKSSEIKKKH